MRRWPDRVIPFAVVQPKAGRAAIDELARCVDAGMRGVGELGPYGQGYRLDDPDFLRLAEACIRLDIPMNLHANEEVGRYYPGKATTPARALLRAGRRYPELKLILAHWGGGLLFYELMPAVRAGPAQRLVRHGRLAADFPHRRGSSGQRSPASHRTSCSLLRTIPCGCIRQPRQEPDMRPFMTEIDALGWDEATRRRSWGGMQQACSASTSPRGSRERRPAASPEGGAAAAAAAARSRIVAGQSVSLTAHAFPQTQPIFDAHGIRGGMSRSPYWEPISQAAAVRGYGPEELAHLPDELNEAAEGGEVG